VLPNQFAMDFQLPSHRHLPARQRLRRICAPLNQLRSLASPISFPLLATLEPTTKQLPDALPAITGVWPMFQIQWLWLDRQTMRTYVDSTRFFITIF
jgi:hypothetical protein